MRVTFVTKDSTFRNLVSGSIDPKYTHIFFHLNEGEEEQMINALLGIDTGHFHTDILVIDSDNLSAGTIPLVMTHFLGAGIPVFVRVTTVDVQSLWQMASLGALLFHVDQMNEEFARVLARRKYAQDTLEVENAFAEVYDREELSSAATVSAILWENEYILDRVREYLAKQNGTVRILDIGCGTGRIEEILLSNPPFSEKIESIHAIDFAPMYLKKARERLKSFLSKDQLSRVIFMRRIAEDTRLPAEYFDIVVASFGIVCFSQFHRTLPEVFRVLKPSGMVILNGYNRNALVHDFDQNIEAGAKSLFTAQIDRDKNEMRLGDQVIRCLSFDVEELHAFLKLIGLHPQPERTQTFPTLYGCIPEQLQKLFRYTRKEYIQHFKPLKNQPDAGPTSYQSASLEKDPFQSGFSSVLHKMDMDLTKSLKNRGFYFSMTAIK